MVLAVMVRHLPKKECRRVLIYVGSGESVGFRILALSLSSVLLSLWYCKVIGGGYLLYLALAHFLRHRGNSADEREAESSKPTPWLRGFWGTVTSITLADIAFSIDSILTAVATAEGFPAHFGDRGKLFIVLTGGILGIITMRFVVRYFLILLERFPGLEEGAYYLVAWIGLKLLISGFHQGELLGFHIPEPLFWAVMLGITAVSLVTKPRARRGSEAQLAESLDLLDSTEQESGEVQGKQSDRRTEEPPGTEKPAPAE